MYKIYGIPNCDTVKKALMWLKTQNIPIEFYDYKKQGISLDKIDDWLTQTSLDVLINRKGTTWKNIPEAQRPSTENKLKALMISSPSVIKRPILEFGQKIVAIGFSEEEYQKKLLKA